MTDMEITVTSEQYSALALAAEANGFGDLTVRECLEIRVELMVDELATAEQ